MGSHASEDSVDDVLRDGPLQTLVLDGAEGADLSSDSSPAFVGEEQFRIGLGTESLICPFGDLDGERFRE